MVKIAQQKLKKPNEWKVKENEKDLVRISQPVGVFKLFKFATVTDTLVIALGTVAALLSAAAMPIFMILRGFAVQSFVNEERSGNFENLGNSNISTDGSSPQSGEEMMATITWFGISAILLSLCLWAASGISVTCFNLAAARQVFRIRQEFLRALLKQDMAWYDTNTTTNFAGSMTEDLNKLQEGIGEKLGMLIFYSGSFFLSISVAFYYGWDLTLVILSLVPLNAFFGGVAAKVQSSFAGKEMQAYAKAGAIAEEVLSALRTVVAFGGQKKEVERYDELLEGAKKKGVLRGMITGLSGGISFGIMFAMYGLGIWYGIHSIMNDREGEECSKCAPEDLDCFEACQRYTSGNVFTVFVCVLVGSFRIGFAAPYLEAFTIARGAAAKIYEIIERVPQIDSSSAEGISPNRINASIKFKNISFSYPSRPDAPILDNLSLEVEAGKTIALVGSSGCGKSTLIQLLQRFYDPDQGIVELDGKNIKDLNLGWLRDNIGIVGQEPVLFDLTIRENIRLGNTAASNHDIEVACKSANAYNFIQRLPEKLDSNVGEGGAQLSGGQKQRIAIARALLRNPKILLLDEATSALDTESEKVVQEALDQARNGRTTLVVAHRLSTIRNADTIVALEKGSVKEMGTHEELMEKKGLYHSLVLRQTAEKEPESKDTQDISKLEHKTEDDKYVHPSSESVTDYGTLEAFDEPPFQFSLDEKGEKVDQEELPKGVMLRLLRTNQPEMPYIILGCLATVAVASMMPILAVLFGSMLKILSFSDIEKARTDSTYYALLMLVLCGSGALSQSLQGLMFSISGENLTKRLRVMAFKAMLAQEMGWHDRAENNTGSLCARLSNDASKVQGASGSRIGTVLHATCAMVIGIGVGVFYEWRLGLAGTLLFPIMVASVVINQKTVNGANSKERKIFEKSAKLAVEAITNIRTVAGLRCETKYLEMYTRLLIQPHRHNMKKAYLRGLIFGFTQCIVYVLHALMTWYGGYLVYVGITDFSLVFTVSEATLSGAWIMGNAFAFTGDLNSALMAASRIFCLLDRTPVIRSDPTQGTKLKEVQGNIDLKQAVFSYPSRRNLQVLNQLNLSIKAGENIALVGESGCGKSTVLQLIQRLYDVERGNVEVEGENIEEVNLPHLRSKLGIVAQEPVLFDRTIRENIQYGNNERDVSMEEVIEAARKANVHEFISALPNGYETRVGLRGSQLSGGQKQRVAIARMLTRDPKILLLDEATSALDTESEKVVQEALERAQSGRTCITIAHRLTTIMSSDRIFVIARGQLVECGTHSELLQLRGSYFNLWNNSAPS